MCGYYKEKFHVNHLLYPNPSMKYIKANAHIHVNHSYSEQKKVPIAN